MKYLLLIFMLLFAFGETQAQTENEAQARFILIMEVEDIVIIFALPDDKIDLDLPQFQSSSLSNHGDIPNIPHPIIEGYEIVAIFFKSEI